MHHFTNNKEVPRMQCFGGGEEACGRVLEWLSLLAELSASWTLTYNHPPLGEPLAKYGSTNMTNLHQKLGCLPGLASLAGTMDKTPWPVRPLASSPPILPSNCRGDADWGMDYKPLHFVIPRSWAVFLTGRFQSSFQRRSVPIFHLTNDKT